jgi:hypothetical protein
MRRSINYLAILILLVSMPAEGHSEEMLREPEYRSFVAAHTFPYVASEARTRQILDNFKNLKRGLTKQDVNGIIGLPDYSHPIYSKRIADPIVGWSWTYFLEKPDPYLVNEKLDIHVEISFDEAGLAYRIYTNIPGLVSID